MLIQMTDHRKARALNWAAHRRSVAAAVADVGPGIVTDWALDDSDAQGAETALRHALARLEALGRISRGQAVSVILDLRLGGEDGWDDDEPANAERDLSQWGCIPPDDAQ